jgi:hypothetical protein
MSVYYKENEIFLNQSLESVWSNQFLKPNEINEEFMNFAKVNSL